MKSDEEKPRHPKLPNTRECNALKNMTRGYWERRGTLRAGDITINALLQNGWIEADETNKKDIKYRITDIGCELQWPTTPLAKPKRKTIPFARSRLKIVN